MQRFAKPYNLRVELVRFQYVPPEVDYIEYEFGG